MTSNLTKISLNKLFDFKNGERIFKTIIEAITPPTSLTVSQWADKFLFLPTESSNEPGLWRTSRTPYLKGIMDALSINSKFTHISVMKGAQLGLTEAGNNWIGYIIDFAPATAMFLMP